MNERPDQDLPDEQQLEEYLRGGSDVSKQYRQLQSSDVPAELDRLVMRQAQEAVKSRPAKSRTWMRWTGPLALAASAVLVVSIVIESGVHKETYLSAPASAPAEIATGAAEKRATGVGAQQDKAAAAESVNANGASDASVVHIAPVAPEPSLYDAPPPAAFTDQAPAPAEERTLAIQPTAPPPVAAPVPQVANVRAAAPKAEAQSLGASAERREQIESVEVNSARMRAPAPQASVSSPVIALEEDSDLQDVIVTGTRRPEAKRSAGPRNTIAAPAHRQADEEDEPQDYSDPEHWLRDIRKLRKQNKHEEADREWRRFRYVYPNYEVADDDTARGTER